MPSRLIEKDRARLKGLFKLSTRRLTIRLNLRQAWCYTHRRVFITIYREAQPEVNAWSGTAYFPMESN